MRALRRALGLPKGKGQNAGAPRGGPRPPKVRRKEMFGTIILKVLNKHYALQVVNLLDRALDTEDLDGVDAAPHLARGFVARVAPEVRLDGDLDCLLRSSGLFVRPLPRAPTLTGKLVACRACVMPEKRMTAVSRAFATPMTPATASTTASKPKKAPPPRPTPAPFSTRLARSHSLPHALGFHSQGAWDSILRMPRNPKIQVRN